MPTSRPERTTPPERPSREADARQLELARGEGGGRYALRLHVSAPEFPRHDRMNGRRYASAVDVEFRDVQVTPGQS